MSEGIREQQIFNVIDAGYRTVGGMCSRLGVSRDAMEEDLDYLVDERKLKRFEQGTIIAYFRVEENPVKVRLNGDGKVHSEFYGEVEKASPSSNGASHKPRRGGPGHPLNITPDQLEKAAAECKTMDQIAAAVGVAGQTLYNKLKDPALKAALERGKAKRNGTTPSTVSTIPRTPVADPEVKPFAALPGDKPVHTKALTFRNGGQVLVAFEGELFDLETSELGIINELGNVLRKFEASHA